MKKCCGRGRCLVVGAAPLHRFKDHIGLPQRAWMMALGCLRQGATDACCWRSRCHGRELADPPAGRRGQRRAQTAERRRVQEQAGRVDESQRGAKQCAMAPFYVVELWVVWSKDMVLSQWASCAPIRRDWVDGARNSAPVFAAACCLSAPFQRAPAQGSKA